MALVAYSDDSDLGSDSEGGEESIERSVTKYPAEVVEESAKDRGSLQAKVAEGNDMTSRVYIIDEDEDQPQQNSSLFASVPPAKTPANIEYGFEIDELDQVTDVPTVDTWKVTKELKENSLKNISQADSSKSAVGSRSEKKEKRKVKFFVPSLSEFSDEDEDEEDQVIERKKLKPSSTGTGLISLLPEPKQVYVKEAKRSLVPHILTKKPVKAHKPPKGKPAPVGITQIGENYSDDDEDSAHASDFFSLSESPAHVVNTRDVEILGRKLPVEQVVTQQNIVPKEPAMFSENTSSNSQQYMPIQEAYHPPQSADVSSENHNSIDEEAMLRLAGKRRGKGEVINFIDVVADDALLTRDEWMTKALTEEKPIYGFSKKREGLPSQKQKQKHHITYLAHIAKERELELKNNWAQNRMTKMQTQAKYGF